MPQTQEALHAGWKQGPRLNTSPYGGTYVWLMIVSFMNFKTEEVKVIASGQILPGILMYSYKDFSPDLAPQGLIFGEVDSTPTCLTAQFTFTSGEMICISQLFIISLNFHYLSISS